MLSVKRWITWAILLLVLYLPWMTFIGLQASQKETTSCPHAQHFNFPVGPPNAKGYYNAQPFQKNYHLGDDWNGKGGGNTDLGDPVYSIAHGQVTLAADLGGGWGNVVRVCHNIGTPEAPVYIESLYAHLDKILVTPDMLLKQGQQLGTIGNAGGQYYAHLHLEIRDTLGLPIGKGYSPHTKGFVDPTQFIRMHR